MKKKLFLALFMVLGISMMTACGNKTEESEQIQDPLAQETQLGLNLKDKARDAVDKQGGNSTDADSLLENTPE